MKSLNQVQLIGNLGKDVELKYTPSGKAVAKLTIATNEYAKDKGEKTEWHNVVLWEKTAEVAGEYLKKGSKVYIEGRLQTRSWDDKATGQKKYMTEIVGNNLIMLSSAEGQGQSSSQSSQAMVSEGGPAIAADEDLPF